VLRSARPGFHELSDFRSEVPRRFDRTLSGSGPPRSAFAVSGWALRVFSLAVTTGFEADGTPLCGLPCSSKPSFRPSAGSASAWRIHLSWGSVPYSARQLWVPVCPGGSTLRHHPPSGFLTLSTSCFTQNHAGFLSAHVLETLRPHDYARPLRSWGSTGPPSLARDLSITGRAMAPSFPLQGLLLPRDEPVLAGSPLSRFTSPLIRLLVQGNRAVKRATQSLDRRRIGVSQRSDPRAPAFMRFLADLRARSRRAVR
jgi:hypothetical protein